MNEESFVPETEGRSRLSIILCKMVGTAEEAKPFFLTRADDDKERSDDRARNPDWMGQKQ